MHREAVERPTIDSSGMLAGNIRLLAACRGVDGGSGFSFHRAASPKQRKRRIHSAGIGYHRDHVHQSLAGGALSDQFDAAQWIRGRLWRR